MRPDLQKLDIILENQAFPKLPLHIKKCCSKLIFLTVKGGFQLLDLIITELKSHVTCHNSMPISLHWLKLQHSDWRANLVRDFFDK